MTDTALTAEAPYPPTGPDAAPRLHYTDPRVSALSMAAYGVTDSTGRPWDALDWNEQHAWRTAGRDWLRAAVATGLLPLVVPSTGQALAAVPLDVRPLDGRPRTGSRGRAQAFRDAALAIGPEVFGWGGPDHADAWREAQKRLREIAAVEDADQAGILDHPDAMAAALVRIQAWADQLDDQVQRKERDRTARHPIAVMVRHLLDPGDNGEDPQ
ncbi:hypothetical protein [Streptomyces sp. NBC_00120]|uniref:hypothetical protein n=1 Tax=Streptomyces sp. NBC_00120 TaxID=2975660 RepID=UPI00225A53D5|nr:hypothetical protein [Streptomyces sp. NBC_00120]MCX5326347.1 hypothetical protein [Streptomyces sp. NBC_00120]